MRILITSYVFYPVTGGISTSSALLAREFTRAGHEVRIVTASPAEDWTGEANDSATSPWEIFRAPTAWGLIKHLAWADVVLSVHLSLRLAWPLFFLRRPWVVAHHSWLTTVGGEVTWLERLKCGLTRYAASISVSRAVARNIGSESVVIGAPYDSDLFRPSSEVPRNKDLLFVGRLVSSKGVNVLLQALDKLRELGHTPALTIVGDGPEMSSLVAQSRTLRLEQQVSFVGQRVGNALRESFCAHRIVVVPSVTPETFGIVAVEAIACGCVVVGSDRAGGLSEAIGPCGVVFKLGDPESLARCLADLLTQPMQVARLQKGAAAHAAQFGAGEVAGAYLKIMGRAVAAVGAVAQIFFISALTL